MPKLSNNQIGDRPHTPLEALGLMKAKPSVAIPPWSLRARRSPFSSKVC